MLEVGVHHPPAPSQMYYKMILVDSPFGAQYYGDRPEIFPDEPTSCISVIYTGHGYERDGPIDM